MTSPTVAATERNLRDLGIRSHSIDEHSCVVALTGEVDLVSAPGFKAALTDLCGLGYTQFVLDLSGVAHMDSTGLGVLVGLQNRLEGRGHLTLAAVPSNLAQLISMLGLDSRIPIFPTVEAALGETDGAAPRSPVALDVPHPVQQAGAEPHPPARAKRGKAVPTDADAGLVLGLAATALPFAGSELAEAECWLRILRRYGDAAQILRDSGVQESPSSDLDADGSRQPGGSAATRPEDRLADVTGQAQGFAAQRRVESVGTVEVLMAVIAVYGPDFDRVLSAYAGDRQALDAHLRAATVGD